MYLLSLSYNAVNCLEKAVIDASRTVYYQYDSSGQRVRKTTVNTAASLTESRLYVGSWEVYRRKSSTGTVTLERETLHLSDDSGRVALIDTRTIGTGAEPAQLLRYQYSNHLGSAALETDGAGVVISYEEYYPYGSTSGRSGRWAATKRYRYTGKERDEESGFYYHGARYYAPWLGRWIAADPLESKYAGLSPYNYGFNNPVKWTDSTGMEPDGGDNKGGARLETKQPTSGQWEQHNDKGYTGEAAPPFQLDGIMVTPTKSSPVNAGDNAPSSGSSDYRWVDISGAKISRYGYSEGGFSDPYNYARFVDNVFFSAWNAVVDVGDAFLNSENTLRATWDYLSYTGSYVANTSAQQQWSDAKSDFKSMATNIQTYENVGALLLTSKFSLGNLSTQGKAPLLHRERTILSDDVAATFRFKKYSEETVESPLILSRYYDNEFAFAKGRFMTEPSSMSGIKFLDRMGLAIKPKWNGMTKVANWEIPSGTKIYKGKAGMQFPWIGGKVQYFIPDISNIKRLKNN